MGYAEHEHLKGSSELSTTPTNIKPRWRGEAHVNERQYSRTGKRQKPNNTRNSHADAGRQKPRNEGDKVVYEQSPGNELTLPVSAKDTRNKDEMVYQLVYPGSPDRPFSRGEWIPGSKLKDVSASPSA